MVVIWSETYAKIIGLRLIEIFIWTEVDNPIHKIENHIESRKEPIAYKTIIATIGQSSLLVFGICNADVGKFDVFGTSEAVWADP